MIRKRSLRLALAPLAAVALLSSLTAASASAAVTGAGSSLAGAVMSNWTNGFSIKEGISVTYSRTTGEAALAKLNSRSIDFAAVDAPLSPEQAAACNNCAQIPWLLSGVDLSFKLSGVKKLNLSGKVLAGIYTGKITRWNDPKIAALNPKVKLPGTKITPVFPSEASGTTYGFTSLLSKVSPAWKKSVGAVSAIKFPVGTAAAGDSGVGAAVNATNGAIGYVSATYASAAGLRVAKVENAAGNFEAPSAESLTAAGAAVGTVPASGIVNVAYPPKSAPDAYPLAMFGYAVVPHTAPQKALDQQFLNYVVGPGQKLGEAFDIVPMPKSVKTAAREMIAAL